MATLFLRYLFATMKWFPWRQKYCSIVWNIKQNRPYCYCRSISDCMFTRTELILVILFNRIILFYIYRSNSDQTSEFFALHACLEFLGDGPDSRCFNSLLTSIVIAFANSLDPDQARQNVGPDQDSNCLPLWWCFGQKQLKTIFFLKKKVSKRQKARKPIQ